MNSDNSYKTKQRELVLAYLKEKNNCVSAEEIINYFKKTNTPVSKTTVYRCLDKFVKDGLISKYINEKRESAQYKINKPNCISDKHFHLKCTDCGDITCADCNFVTSIDRHFSQHHKFKLNQTQTIFYGICSQCSS